MDTAVWRHRFGYVLTLDFHTGTGHVRRCLALAQAWQSSGGRIVFLGEVDKTLSDRLRHGGFLPLARAVAEQDAATTVRPG